jgi:hypothetical protein
MSAVPEYRLDRHDPSHDHGPCGGVVEIMVVTDLDEDTRMTRRAAIRAGVTVAGVIALVAGCAADPGPVPNPPTARPTPTPSPTPTPPPVRATSARPSPKPAPKPTPKPKPAPKPTRTRRSSETLPCPGGPVAVPPGKVCTCNCVPVGLG